MRRYDGQTQRVAAVPNGMVGPREWSGYSGHVLETHNIPCAFCGAVGNFGAVQHLERKKPGNGRKVLNYDTLQCGNCGNYMFAFWSAAMFGHGSGAVHDYRVLPWHQSTTSHPKHWPPDVGNYWVKHAEALKGRTGLRQLMARSAVQLVARAHGAKGKNLKEEINDLAAKGLILPIMNEWVHEVRELAMRGRIRSRLNRHE